MWELREQLYQSPLRSPGREGYDELWPHQRTGVVDSLPSPYYEPVRDDVSIYNNYEPRVWTEVTPRKPVQPVREKSPKKPRPSKTDASVGGARDERVDAMVGGGDEDGYRYGLSITSIAEALNEGGANALSLRLTCRFPVSLRVLIFALLGFGVGLFESPIPGVTEILGKTIGACCTCAVFPPHPPPVAPPLPPPPHRPPPLPPPPPSLPNNGWMASWFHKVPKPLQGAMNHTVAYASEGIPMLWECYRDGFIAAGIEQHCDASPGSRSSSSSSAPADDEENNIYREELYEMLLELTGLDLRSVDTLMETDVPAALEKLERLKKEGEEWLNDPSSDESHEAIKSEIQRVTEASIVKVQEKLHLSDEAAAKARETLQGAEPKELFQRLIAFSQAELPGALHAASLASAEGTACATFEEMGESTRNGLTYLMSQLPGFIIGLWSMALIALQSVRDKSMTALDVVRRVLCGREAAALLLGGLSGVFLGVWLRPAPYCCPCAGTTAAAWIDLVAVLVGALLLLAIVMYWSPTGWYDTRKGARRIGPDGKESPYSVPGDPGFKEAKGSPTRSPTKSPKKSLNMDAAAKVGAVGGAPASPRVLETPQVNRKVFVMH